MKEKNLSEKQIKNAEERIFSFDHGSSIIICKPRFHSFMDDWYRKALAGEENICVRLVWPKISPKRIWEEINFSLSQKNLLLVEEEDELRLKNSKQEVLCQSYFFGYENESEVVYFDAILRKTLGFFTLGFFTEEENPLKLFLFIKEFEVTSESEMITLDLIQAYFSQENNENAKTIMFSDKETITTRPDGIKTDLRPFNKCLVLPPFS